MSYFKITDGKKVGKTSEIIKRLRKKFDVYVHDEENIDKNFPIPKKTTTRYFKKTEESDPEFKNKSFDDVKHLPPMTFREYLLASMEYFDETGKHLDSIGWTILADRLSLGGVAFGRWYRAFRKAGFYWYCAGYRDSLSGARVAVSSLDLETSGSGRLAGRGSITLPPFIMVSTTKYVKE